MSQLETNNLQKNQQVIYSAHLCCSLSTIFEYIHICLSWKQETLVQKKLFTSILEDILSRFWNRRWCRQRWKSWTFYVCSI